MKRALVFIAAFACALSLSAKERTDRSSKVQKLTSKSGAPASTEPQTASGYDAFPDVKLKNIFDPTRRGMRTDAAAAAASADAAKKGRSLALTGTMVTEGKTLAFFGGSAAEGSRVIEKGNSVAGYKLTGIAPTEVAMERDGKQVVLQVGKQLTFEGDGPSAATDVVVEKAAEPTPEVTGAPALPGVSNDKAEILKRMMERRAKEVGK